MNFYKGPFANLNSFALRPSLPEKLTESEAEWETLPMLGDGFSFFKNETFRLWIDRFWVPIDDPGSRLFHMNIASSLILILIFAWLQRRPLLHTLKKTLFRKNYWWNTSTKIDYQVYALNSVLKVLLFIPFLDFSFGISRWTVKSLLKLNGDFMGLSSAPVYLVGFTVLAFLFDDFLRFFHHYLMHKIPFLWRFHKTHHSARVLTPMTLYRTHPIESATAALRNSLSIGVATGAFIFMFEAQMSLLTFFGVNVFGFVFNFLGSNLRHSHIPLAFGPFEKIFISPKMHQIHHSRKVEHYDRNFGVSLSLWDAVVGARIFSRETSDQIRVGLDERHSKSVWVHLADPFLPQKPSPPSAEVINSFSSSSHSHLNVVAK